MTEQFDDRKTLASAWFRSLRDDIVAAFESLEDSQSEGETASERQRLGRFQAGRHQPREGRGASGQGGDVDGPRRL